jgi:hypothetical protein
LKNEITFPLALCPVPFSFSRGQFFKQHFRVVVVASFSTNIQPLSGSLRSLAPFAIRNHKSQISHRKYVKAQRLVHRLHKLPQIKARSLAEFAPFLSQSRSFSNDGAGW